MSLQLSAQVNGSVSLLFGSGAIPSTARVVGGLSFDEFSRIYAASSGAVAHVLGGVPVDSNGRVLSGSGAISNYVNGLPVSSNGYLAGGGVAITNWSGGLPFDRDGNLVAWNPQVLFAGGEVGFLNTLGLDTLFTDTAGTTPVTAIGDTIALGLDQSGNSNDMVQATAAERPVYGRMPEVGVRNLFPARSDDRAVTNGAQVGSGSSFQINTYDGYDSLLAVTGGLSGREYAVGAPGIWYAIRFQARKLAGSGWFRDPAASSTALRAVDYLVYDLGSESEDWVDCVLIGTPPDPTRIYYRLLWDAVPGLEIALRNIQVEMVEPNTTEPTAYQSVGAARYDITQPGTLSVPIAYMDTSDDAFSWTLPAGTYHLFIAGDLGCYFDTVAHAGGEFTVGPTSWTGGPADAITTLIGQRHVIMPVIRDEVFTQSEKELMVAYVMARGGGEVWNAGAEMFRDPSFDDAGVWSGSGIASGEMVVSGGVLTITNLSGPSAASDAGISPQIVSGSLYIGEFTIDSTDGGNLRFQASGYIGTVFATTGLKRQIIVAPAASNFLALQGATIGLDAVVSSISSKLLTQSSTPI